MEKIITDENFNEEIKSTDKLVLVDFFAEWCGPCKTLGPILEKIGEEMKDTVKIIKANVDNIPLTAQKFGVEKIPTVVLFKNKKPISGFVGLIPEEEIKNMIIKNSDQSPAEAEDKKEITEKMKQEFKKHAEDNNIKLNPDEKTVERIIDGLLRNEEKYGAKYCPCRRVSGDKEKDSKKICPCVWHKDEVEKDGHCFCRLYVK